MCKAIASFERAVVSNDSPFDRWVAGIRAVTVPIITTRAKRTPEAVAQKVMFPMSVLERSKRPAASWPRSEAAPAQVGEADMQDRSGALHARGPAPQAPAGHRLEHGGGGARPR
ncbi:MAG: hypothetical protein KIT17_10535 [Rubrivivax sp.]|nr:hypothetical protein [Rubrivivax sp.]